MVLAIFNPWKLANNNILIPDNLDLLSLLFDALPDHLRLIFWHKSVAFDGIQPKKIMIFAIFNPWKLANSNLLFPAYLDLLSFLFDTFQDHLWLSFWYKSIAFDGIQPKKIMVLAMSSPWKLANNFFLIPDYLELLSLLFDALRDHLWLSFWHKSIAIDGIQPKKILILAIFNP